MEYEYENVSIGSWVFSIIMWAIPIVNIIYILGCLFGFAKKPKVTLTRAFFIVGIIMIALYLAFIIGMTGDLSVIGEQIKLIGEVIAELIERIGK